jgi:hypothetical protein
MVALLRLVTRTLVIMVEFEQTVIGHRTSSRIRPTSTTVKILSHLSMYCSLFNYLIDLLALY